MPSHVLQPGMTMCGPTGICWFATSTGKLRICRTVEGSCSPDHSGLPLQAEFSFETPAPGKRKLYPSSVSIAYPCGNLVLLCLVSADGHPSEIHCLDPLSGVRLHVIGGHSKMDPMPRGGPCSSVDNMCLADNAPVGAQVGGSWPRMLTQMAIVDPVGPDGLWTGKWGGFLGYSRVTLAVAGEGGGVWLVPVEVKLKDSLAKRPCIRLGLGLGSKSKPKKTKMLFCATAQQLPHSKVSPIESEREGIAVTALTGFSLFSHEGSRAGLGQEGRGMPGTGAEAGAGARTASIPSDSVVCVMGVGWQDGLWSLAIGSSRESGEWHLHRRFATARIIGKGPVISIVQQIQGQGQVGLGSGLGFGERGAGSSHDSYGCERESPRGSARTGVGAKGAVETDARNNKDMSSSRGASNKKRTRGMSIDALEREAELTPRSAREREGREKGVKKKERTPKCAETGVKCRDESTQIRQDHQDCHHQGDQDWLHVWVSSALEFALYEVPLGGIQGIQGIQGRHNLRMRSPVAPKPASPAGGQSGGVGQSGSHRDPIPHISMASPRLVHGEKHNLIAGGRPQCLTVIPTGPQCAMPSWMAPHPHPLPVAVFTAMGTTTKRHATPQLLVLDVGAAVRGGGRGKGDGEGD
ncbi:unnamed protein product, partial [Discosporangium mesarthrocarpum]